MGEFDVHVRRQGGDVLIAAGVLVGLALAGAYLLLTSPGQATPSFFGEEPSITADLVTQTTPEGPEVWIR